MNTEDKKSLEQKLWAIANELRGKMSADEYKDYILGFIFYKYLSERMEEFANKILYEDWYGQTGGAKRPYAGQPHPEGMKDYASRSGEKFDGLEQMRKEAIKGLGYFLLPSELFSKIAERGKNHNFIIEDLGRILANIEASTRGQASEEEFVKLFEDVDLQSTKLGKEAKERNKVIARILSHLSQTNFKLDESDALGDAYEYLISQFAAGAGKKSGEFYTPQQVSKILAKIVTLGKNKLRSVYDPSCGSGSLLLRVARELKNEVSKFHGQELNRTTHNLARMNMILHDVHYSKFDIKQGDTLENPLHRDERFEAIVANPPFSAHWSARQSHMDDERFSDYGKLAPKTKADYAFVQHMLFQLDEGGTMAVVLPHGVLFRGAAEGQIRKYIIKEKNYLDAVIGLPGNIFYGTSIPTCILVFKKCREDDENILCIDASQEFEKRKSQNYLTDEHIDKIITTLKERVAITGYSYLAPLSEVVENDYNLNIPRYVDSFEEEPPINMESVSQELHALDAQISETDTSIASFCDELGITPPFTRK